MTKTGSKFYHYDVIIAKFENLASQICCSAHWESNFRDGLQRSFCFVAVNRQTISFDFLLSFSNPDHDLSKLKEIQAILAKVQCPFKLQVVKFKISVNYLTFLHDF